MVLLRCGDRFFSLTGVFDPNRRMFGTSSVPVATSFLWKLDVEDPLRSFTADAAEEVDDTHYDAEPLEAIPCIAGSLQPMIKFSAISE